jgi:excinuclease ABC subunit B
MYAEETTRSMSQAILEMERRRHKQSDYNRAHGITPRTISKSYQEVLISTSVADSKEAPKVMEPSLPAYRSGMSVRDLIVELETGMMKAAENLEFEKAAVIRDEIKRIKSMFNTGEEGLDAGM